MILYSGDVAFFLVGNTVDHVIDTSSLRGGKGVTSVRVPYEVQSHKNHTIYASMWELEELIAHPESPVYETMDGALCRRTGSIEYIPRGKRSLHIDKKINQIAYKALALCNQLETITVDPDSEYFTVFNNCLFNKEMTRLEFVPRTVKTLILPEQLKTIGIDAFWWMNAEKIEIADGNGKFSVKDDVLYQGSEIIYMQPHVSELHIGKEVQNIRWSLNQIHSITADPLNPRYTVVDNTLFNKNGSQLLYRAGNRDSVTVFLHTEFEKDDNAAEDCMIHVIVDDDRRLSFRGNEKKLKYYQNIIRNHLSDIKPGTEYLFLEMYLTGWNSDESFMRNFKLSTMQILRRIIADNDLEIMKKVLENGTIMTKKHLERNLKQAQDEGKTNMYQLLYDYGIKAGFVKQ